VKRIDEGTRQTIADAAEGIEEAGWPPEVVLISSRDRSE
jgi:hypothetical protein